MALNPQDSFIHCVCRFNLLHLVKKLPLSLGSDSLQFLIIEADRAM